MQAAAGRSQAPLQGRAQAMAAEDDDDQSKLARKSAHIQRKINKQTYAPNPFNKSALLQCGIRECDAGACARCPCIRCDTGKHF